MFKVGETIRRLFKKFFLCVFNRVLGLEERYYRSEICDWGYSNVQGTI